MGRAEALAESVPIGPARGTELGLTAWRLAVRVRRGNVETSDLHEPHVAALGPSPCPGMA